MLEHINHTEFNFGKNKGLWRANCTVYDIMDKNGNVWRPSVYGKTKKEARIKLEAKILERTMGIIDKKMNCSLEKAIERYIISAQVERDVTDSTVNYWKRVLKCQISPCNIAKLNVNRVSHQDVIDFIIELREEGVSQAMQKKAYNILTMFYSDYYESTPFKNPAYGVKFKGLNTKVDISQILNDEEIKLYFDACEASQIEFIGREKKRNPDYERNADLLQFLIVTYMRRGEALALTFRDFLDSDMCVQIKKTVSRNISGERVIKSGAKTSNSIRTLMLNDIAFGILNARLMEASAQEGFTPDWLIFPSEDGHFKPLSDTAVKNANNRILEKAHISKKIRVHDLRHTGISYYLRHGSPLADVSKRAGHSRQSITADIYSHVLDETLKIQSERESKLTEEFVKW